MTPLSQNTDYVRNIIFGLEDGFVSTCGVLFGISTASANSHYILIAGVITVLVEATSMGAGAYLSEKSSREITIQGSKSTRPAIDGVAMFIAYTIAGSLCVLPYTILQLPWSQITSVLLTLTGLFLTGYLPRKKIKRGIEILIVAGVAIFIGFIAGKILSVLTSAY